MVSSGRSWRTWTIEPFSWDIILPYLLRHLIFWDVKLIAFTLPIILKYIGQYSVEEEKLYSPLCHLSIIPLKDFFLFKIAKSVISFCLKKIYNLTILNTLESFIRIVDHVTCPPWGPYNFSWRRQGYRYLQHAGWKHRTTLPRWISFLHYTTYVGCP